MTSYSDLIAKAAGTDDGVPYDGDFLTNSVIHERIKAIGVDLGSLGAGLGVHEQMRGAAAEAARSELGQSRAQLQGVEDAINAMIGAATAASATIDTGKSNDPSVKAALASSESEYVKHIQGADDEVEAGQEVDGGGDRGDSGGSNRAKPGEGQESGGGAPAGPGSPDTHTSSDQDSRGPGSGSNSPTAPSASMAQPAAQQQPMQQATPMTQQPMMGQAGGGMQQPGGMPISSPRTSTGSPEYSKMIREAIAEEQSRAAAKAAGPIPRGISPKADPSGSDGPGVVAAPVPTGNPTVTGGAVDPATTSGRTASTTTSGAPGAGVPSRPTGPMPMGGGMMGGMGAMGQGLGGGQPPAGPQSPPKIRRDKDTEAVLDGTAARDEALISSILTDDDLILSGDDGDTDELLDDLRNELRDEEPAEDEKW